MAFPWNIKYPNVNDEILNLDWVLKEIQEMQKAIDGIAEGILSQANAYTDEQLANYQQQVEDIRTEMTALVRQVETDFDNLQVQINISLRQMELRIEDLQDQLAADINAVNARTDLAIEQNNEYLLSHMEEYLSGIKVLNALTGIRVSIQDMFNFLCSLHASDSIDYTDLAAANNTYTQLANYHMTYTQLAMNGSNIIQVNP